MVERGRLTHVDVLQRYLEKVEEATFGEAGKDYRTIKAYDPYGHVVWEVAGNGVDTKRTYGPAGRSEFR